MNLLRNYFHVGNMEEQAHCYPFCSSLNTYLILLLLTPRLPLAALCLQRSNLGTIQVRMLHQSTIGIAYAWIYICPVLGEEQPLST